TVACEGTTGTWAREIAPGVSPGKMGIGFLFSFPRPKGRYQSSVISYQSRSGESSRLPDSGTDLDG
ncbi:MAG: hypothetical protein WHS88_11690, partial [Anaerohalosphaeraceae bacterium]